MGRLQQKKELAREPRIEELCEKLEKILEMGDDGIIVTEKTGRVEYVNTIASVITGFSKEELYRGGIGLFLSEESLNILADMEKEISGDESRKVCTEMHVIHKTGNLKDCEVCIAVGKINGRHKLYIYMRDITVRKRMEAQVRLTEEKYRYLFESIRHGVYVSSKEGKFTDCNRAMVEMLGYENKEQILALDLTRDVYENPEDRRNFQRIIEKEGYVKEYEVTFKKKNGETITILLTSQTNNNERNEVIGYQGMMMDITGRKKMEKDLREVNHFLNRLIEASPDGIIVTDSKGDIIIYNKAAEQLLGYGRDELIGRANIKDLYPRGLARKIRETMLDEKSGKKGILPPTELYVKNKAGEVIDISLSASIIYDEKGDELASIGIFNDLSEMIRVKRKLKETQDQLFQAERLAAMGRLTSQIAHELNNPLYGIMNTLELLKAEIPEASRRRRLLDMSLSEVVRLSVMLKNMLTFSRPEEEARKEIDISTFLESILMLFEKQLLESDIKLITAFDETVPAIMVSPGQMRQVFLNIIKNGVEAMPHGGTLSVATKIEDNHLMIVVRDTGMGMDEEVKEKIFDAFFTTKEEVRGVGLGLSVCYGIIQDHGGTIDVESAPGKGSTFTVLLPIK
ncbi:MAG: PAS domain S-box protein [Methanoregula sp.]|jgi:two-component system NtrC family sensor kinase|uniref:PAS domain-containing sensor histidine kinase n=1 Tax=Methanoregula sp. TaxID=2052170 RepID=UPI003C26F1CA